MLRHRPHIRHKNVCEIFGSTLTFESSHTLPSTSKAVVYRTNYLTPRMWASFLISTCIQTCPSYANNFANWGGGLCQPPLSYCHPCFIFSSFLWFVFVIIFPTSFFVFLVVAHHLQHFSASVFHFSSFSAFSFFIIFIWSSYDFPSFSIIFLLFHYFPSLFILFHHFHHLHDFLDFSIILHHISSFRSYSSIS